MSSILDANVMLPHCAFQQHSVQMSVEFVVGTVAAKDILIRLQGMDMDIRVCVALMQL